MLRTALEAVLIGGMALLIVSAYAASFVWRSHPWSTRVVPSTVSRVGVGVIFAAWVDPSFGLLAALAGFWWAVQGFDLAPGGTLWPLIAMTVWIGTQAPPPVVHAGLALFLAMGVLQSAVAVTQQYPALARVNFFPAAAPHGTIGHRTGLGIYLAALIPLAFLTDYGWLLTLAYLPGLVLARSLVAMVAAAVGLLWVTAAWWAIPAMGVLSIPRLLKFSRSYSGELGFMGMKFRHLPESFYARLQVWELAMWHALLWPHWLIGHGGLSFDLRARTWIVPHQLRERYGEAHNDYVEFFYEYGVLGVCAVLLWGWTYRDSFGWGEPLTGAMLAFGVSMLASFPIRVSTLTALAVFLIILVMR